MNESVPPVARIRDGVLLTGRALELTVFAIDAAQRYRAHQGLAPLPALNQLRALMSPPGQADMLEESSGQAEVVARISTRDAAALLGCSERHVRRLAPMVGGELVGGRWLLDRQAVLEHIGGSR